jgi:hypothetical protein
VRGGDVLANHDGDDARYRGHEIQLLHDARACAFVASLPP